MDHGHFDAGNYGGDYHHHHDIDYVYMPDVGTSYSNNDHVSADGLPPPNWHILLFILLMLSLILGLPYLMLHNS